MREIYTFDIEANNLLNEEVIDYLSSPYKLKDSFDLHCIVMEQHTTGKIIAFYDGEFIPLDGRKYSVIANGYKYFLEDYQEIEYEHRPLSEFRQYIKDNVESIVAHNGINYDMLVCKLYFEMDYEIDPDTWDGKDIEINDTLVTSKTLNPDRFGGHSLDALGKKVGLNKLEFRKHIPKEIKFQYWYADMLYYCIRDVQVNTKVYKWVEKEKEGWKWDEAIILEKKVMELITRQEHRGFLFDKDLAESNILELDYLMKERKDKIEPILPPREATQAFLKEHTPPVRQLKEVSVYAPAKQFKMDGDLSSTMLKFVEKYEGKVNSTKDKVKIFDKIWELPIASDTCLLYTKELTEPMLKFIEEHNGTLSKDLSMVDIGGNIYPIPMPVEPVETQMVATLSDTTHIKEWLVSLGWTPTEWKDRDISCNAKKIKLSDEDYEKAVDKYVIQTLKSSFMDERCEFLNTTPQNLKYFLMNKNRNRSVKVLTNPSFTKGQEKEICPELEKLHTVFPFAKDIVEYLTYRHRRNSILGGGISFEDEEDAEKGYLSFVREDGRIPTPADTCGAATSRMKHRCVANIPRVTSLYGENMRGLFGVGKDYYQLGYDFDSLEAKEEAHYCYRYEEGEEKEYCNSLTLEKPNDVHSVLARKISKIIGRTFDRSPAKSTKYAATYGATAPKVAKTIGESLQVGTIVFEAFWEAALPLKLLKEALTKYWENTGKKQFVLGIDGRKVPTRSPHAILNSLFQSAGVICAKRAMVIHDQLLKEAGLAVDFFKDDWKNKQWVQQLIAYHDEAQMEVSKGLVTFKTLPIPNLEGKSKDEIKDIHSSLKIRMEEIKKELEISTNNKWSDISHTEKAYYIAHCKAGELASNAVTMAGEYYKLKVPLTAGYIIGRNWAECH